MIQGQSKWASFWEANTNTIVGFLITLIFSPFIYHFVGIKYTFSQLYVVTAAFTVLSVIRGYIVRRWFNKSQASKDKELVKQNKGWKDYAHKLAEQIQYERMTSTKLINEYKFELDSKNEQIHQLQSIYHTVLSDSLEATYNPQTQTHEM